MRQLGMVAILVLCVCAASFGTVTLIDGGANPRQLVYAEGDLVTAIDPPGLAEISEAFPGLSKTAFLALNPQVVDFNVGPGGGATPGSFAYKLDKLTVNYSATGTVEFTFPAFGSYGPAFESETGYNYGGATSAGRQAFSGPTGNCDISTIPSNRDGSTGAPFNCVDIKIATTGNKGVGAIGFCLATRASGGTTLSNPVYFTLSDIATGAISTDSTTVIMPEINMGSSHGFFIGYQAPAGKVITRVEVLDDDNMDQDNANMTCGLDDLAFVMVDTNAIQPLIGDINKDGFVNVGDLQALVAAWGSQETPPSANWNADADINDDGFVNVGDLQLLVAHWGESQP